LICLRVLKNKRGDRTGQAPLTNFSKTAITAITSKIWMIPPALYAKNPIAHEITRITAMIYNRLVITFFF
jgi:hypothetical protein